MPEPGPLDPADARLLDATQSMLDDVGASIAAAHFRQGLQQAFALAQATNRYLDGAEPWKTVKGDRVAAGRALYTALNVIAGLSTALYPYLPFTSRRLRGYLSIEASPEDAGWRLSALAPGTPLQAPQPLFKKLDPSIVAEEEARLGT